MAASITPVPLGVMASLTQVLLAQASQPPPLAGSGARSAPTGAATAPPAQTPQLVANVQLVFLPAGAPAAEAIPARNQQVYIDLTPGTMTLIQSNAQGRLVGVPAAAAALRLDSARNYQVVVAPAPLSPAPAASQGATVRLSGAVLAVAPNIAIKIDRSAGGAAANLACILKIGAINANISTTAAGWIISNDSSAGEAMIRCDRFLLQTAGAATPAATLAISPAAPARGDVATITLNAPAGTAGLKATQWNYDISHTNPGAASPSTATVMRPAAEAPATFDQNWQGELCASGAARTRFVTGAIVRASGATRVNAALVARDPVEIALTVTVAPRAGAPWVSNLVEKPVGKFTRPINSFHDTGHHNWDAAVPAPPATRAPATGPNRGCNFVTGATATFTSTPEINDALTDPASTFSQAQDKAYLTSPAPVRVIPHSLYTAGAGGQITQTPANSIPNHFGITGNYFFFPHCIDQTRLLAGTRRHEFEDPLPNARSHKGNCLRALRALEPVKFAEALVGVPGVTLNFRALFSARVHLVAGVAATHDIVDERQTRSDNAVRFVAGATILGVNVDNSGAPIGPAWNPLTNSPLR